MSAAADRGRRVRRSALLLTAVAFVVYAAYIALAVYRIRH